MTGEDPRQRLLDRAVDHVSTHGIGDLSLRALAAELGTSHRMLIHHFGSKDGLWVAIVREVEDRQREALAELGSHEPTTLTEALRDWWAHISDPEMWPSERLFFELYDRGLQGIAPASDLLDDAVESWVAPAAARAIDLGVDPERADAFARLGVAVSRGLLLDLLATSDRTAVDDAMELWIELNESMIEPGTG